MSLLDVVTSEYSEELPLEIMNHFRTSTPRPAYEEPSKPHLSCDSEQFLSPCNPHLPSFTIKQLSELSMSALSLPTSPSLSTSPSLPSSVSPPSGRVPYPAFLPEYSGMETDFTPLVFSPRQYVPSSTIRPPVGEERYSTTSTTSARENMDITTYKPRITLNLVTSPAPRHTEDRIMERLREILIKLREKKMMEELEENEPKLKINNISKFNQRRKNGQRLYPNNPINPHLPVTSLPLNTTHTEHSQNSVQADDFFTVKNRNLGGASAVLLPSNLLFFLIFLSQHVMGF